MAVVVVVADFLALTRQQILQGINNKMVSPAAQEVVGLVMVHPHLQGSPVVPVWLDKDCQADQAELHLPLPIGHCPVAVVEAAGAEMQVTEASALQLLVRVVVQAVRAIFGP